LSKQVSKTGESVPNQVTIIIRFSLAK